MTSQRWVGNQASLGMLRKPSPEGSASAFVAAAPAITPAPAQISRKCAGCQEDEGSAVKVQAKLNQPPQGASVTPGGSRGALRLGSPTDAAEHEADSVATRLFPSSPGARQGMPERAAATKKGREAGGAGTACGASPGALLGTDTGDGRPLAAGTRGEMETAFGADFGGVRVHTGMKASQLCRGLKAQAFTYGNQIFFDQGRYDPDSTAGKQLLAHELTHTVQQRDAVTTLRRQGAGRTTIQCVNENLSSAGIASWVLAAVAGTCGLVWGLAGSIVGPEGTVSAAALGAAVCLAAATGFSVGFILGIIKGCAGDANFKSAGANVASNTEPAGGAAPAAGAPNQAAKPA